MKGYELIDAVEQATHKICSALALAPVSITWLPSIPTAAINQHGNIFLKDVAGDADVPRAMLHRYCGFVVHELLHRKYTNFRVHDGRQYIDALHNAVEDIWIERQAVAAGLTGNISALLAALIDGIVTEALTEKIDWSNARQYPFALAVHGRRYATIKVPLAAGLAPIFDEASRRIDKCSNSNDTMDVALWVFDQLQQPRQDQQQPQQQDQQQGADGAGKGEGAAGGEAGDGAGDAAGDGEGAGGEAGDGAAADADKGTDKTDGKKQVGQRQVPRANQMAREVEPSSPDAGPPGGGGEYTREKAGRYFDAPVTSSNVFDTAVTTGGRLRYEVKRLFDNTDRADWALKRKMGSLNVRALPSLATGSDRVFKRRDEVDGVDSAVLILLDNSGSMFYGTQGSRLMDAAVPAVVALHQSIKAAGPSVMVASFGRTVQKVADWSANSAKVAERLRNIGDHGATNDAQAIRFCGDILLQRNEERRVLFVITDGNGDVQATQANVRTLQRLGITVIGVGIQVDVSRVYDQCIMVKDTKDLANASFKQIKVAI